MAVMVRFHGLTKLVDKKKKYLPLVRGWPTNSYNERDLQTNKGGIPRGDKVWQIVNDILSNKKVRQ